MDIVYVLGNGSKWENNEIRYSLRSVQKYVTGYRKIFIVGEKPDFLKYNANLVHISFSDDMTINKERRIMEKISYVCGLKQVSPRFLFFNDDHFILKKTSAPQLPYYHKGELEGAINKKTIYDPYRMSLENTYDALKEKGYEIAHFDIHTPIIYDKKKFIRVMSMYDWEIPHGYVIKSLYGNTLGIKGRYMCDCKLSRNLTFNQIMEKIKDRLVFTTGDNINDGMKEALQFLFPRKSKFEI